MMNMCIQDHQNIKNGKGSTILSIVPKPKKDEKNSCGFIILKISKKLGGILMIIKTNGEKLCGVELQCDFQTLIDAKKSEKLKMEQLLEEKLKNYLLDRVGNVLFVEKILLKIKCTSTISNLFQWAENIRLRIFNGLVPNVILKSIKYMHAVWQKGNSPDFTMLKVI